MKYLVPPVKVCLVQVEVLLLWTVLHRSLEVLVEHIPSSLARYLGRWLLFLSQAQVKCLFLLPWQLVVLSTLHPQVSGSLEVV